MLEMVFYGVRQDKVENLKGCMEELGKRDDEALDTFRNEGTRHERRSCWRAPTDPFWSTPWRWKNPRALRADEGSGLVIDREHRRVMGEVLAGRAEVEELLYLSIPPER